jgi:autotransporter-associated beta strand protein
MKNYPTPVLNNLTRTLSALALFAAAAPAALAQSGTWTSTADGAWSTAGNWLSNVVADGNNNTANFNTVNLPSDITVSLDGPRTIGNVIFGDTNTATAGGWTLNNNGNSANILTLAGSGNPTITVNSLGTGKTATISASIAGSQGLQKSGSGTLVLTSSNSYTGYTRVSGGTLVASDAFVYTGATGTSSILGSNASGAPLAGIIFSSNTTLDLRINGNNNAVDQSVAFKNYIYNVSPNTNFTINVDRQAATGGTGKTVNLNSSASILSNGNVMNVTGGNGFRLRLEALNVGTAGSAGNVTLNPTTANLLIGNVTNQGNSNPHTLILDGTSTGNEITGNITNNGVAGVLSLSKTNSSTWTFSNANTYSGGTTITAGTLMLTAAGNLGVGNVTLGSGGTLDISGITGADFTLSSTQVFTADGLVNATGKTLVVNGTLNPGSSPGDLDVTGSFTLGSTSISNFEINGITAGLFDSVQVTGTLTFGGILNLSTGYAFQAGDAVDLFDWGTVTGTFASITGTDLGGGLSWDTSSLYTTGVITVVPEPATWAMITVGGTLLMTLRRRRQS